MAVAVAGDSWGEVPSRHGGRVHVFKTVRPVRRGGAKAQVREQGLGAGNGTVGGEGARPPGNAPDWRTLGLVGSGVAFVFSVLVFVNMSTDDKLAGVTQAVLSVVKRVDRLEVVAERTDQRLDKIESRIEVIDEKLRVMDKRLDGMDKRLDGMDKKLEDMGNKLNDMGTKLNDMGNKLNDMGNKLDRVLGLVAERR